VLRSTYQLSGRVVWFFRSLPKRDRQHGSNPA